MPHKNRFMASFSRPYAGPPWLFLGMTLLLTFFLPPHRVAAQDDSSPDRPLPKGRYVVRSGTIETWTQNGDRLIYLTGSPVLRRANERLSADVIVGWVDTSAKSDSGEKNQNGRGRTFSLREIYAEGNVMYRQTDNYLRSDRFFLDVRTDRGVWKNVTYRTFDENRSVPVVIRADRMEQTGKGRYVATGVDFTTCDYSDPHYSVHANRVYVNQNGTTEVTASNLTPRIQNVPFLYWPFLYYRTDADLGPLKNVEFGDSDRFGSFIKTLWGVRYSSPKRDSEGDVRRDKNGDKIYHYDLDLELEVDYFGRRGWAGGPGGEYEFGKRHSGNFRGYVLPNDDGRNPDVEFDRKFSPIEEGETRGRGRWFHRYDILGLEGDYEQLRLDTEIDYISDRDFREEFLENDFKTDKDPETYAYLRYVNDNAFASVLTRSRLNDFQTQTEYLPGLTHELYGEPIGSSPFRYSTETSVANVRDRLDDRLPGDSLRTTRFDTHQEVAYPFSIGPVQTRAFTSARFSFYDRPRTGEDGLSRNILSGGVRAFDQLHRTFGVRNDSLGLDGLRHIFSWDVRYTNNFHSNRDPDDVRRFDENDPLGEFEEFYFGVRNRFQTRKTVRKKKKTDQNRRNNGRKENDGSPEEGDTEKTGYTFLDVGAAIEFYPDADRDRSTTLEQNVLDPFAWISSPVEAGTGRVLDDNWSLLNLDFEFTPNLPLTLAGNAEVNIEERTLESTVLKLNVHPLEDVTASLRHSYVRRLTETTSLQMRVRLSDHWSVSGRSTYDLRRGEFQKQHIRLGYHLHDFTVLFSSIVDNRRDDNTFALAISPNFTESRVSAFEFEQDEFD